MIEITITPGTRTFVAIGSDALVLNSCILQKKPCLEIVLLGKYECFLIPSNDYDTKEDLKLKKIGIKNIRISNLLNL